MVRENAEHVIARRTEGPGWKVVGSDPVRSAAAAPKQHRARDDLTYACALEMRYPAIERLREGRGIRAVERPVPDGGVGQRIGRAVAQEPRVTPGFADPLTERLGP